MDPVLSTQQSFSSVSEFSDAVSQLGWSATFRQLDCGAGDARFDAIVNPTALLQRVFCERRTTQDVIPPEGYQTFGLPLRSQAPSKIENRPLSDQEFLYIHEQAGFSSVAEPGFDAYTVSIAKSRMSELSGNLQLADPGDSPGLWGTEVQPAPKQLAAIKSIIQKIFTLEQSTTQNPEARASLDDMISLQLPCAILQLDIGPHTGKRIPARNRELALQRALDYIEAHPKEALTVETLCTSAATSLSTLERAFLERFSISPKRYITVQRLNRVHAALIHNPDRRSITDVASEWGFSHTSQFAADYKSLFGYLPSQTPNK